MGEGGKGGWGSVCELAAEAFVLLLDLSHGLLEEFQLIEELLLLALVLLEGALQG